MLDISDDKTFKLLRDACELYFNRYVTEEEYTQDQLDKHHGELADYINFRISAAYSEGIQEERARWLEREDCPAYEKPKKDK